MTLYNCLGEQTTVAEEVSYISFTLEDDLEQLKNDPTLSKYVPKLLEHQKIDAKLNIPWDLFELRSDGAVFSFKLAAWAGKSIIDEHFRKENKNEHI